MIRILLFSFLLAGFAAQAQEPSQPLPFSPARQAGPTLYVSGQVARAPSGEKVLDSIDAETRQVMDNIGRILKQHGYSFDDVVSATVYLRNIDAYSEMNAAYRTYFNKDFPARACVGGQDLVADYNVEISVIAYKED